ncbi:MAG: hypothetical protein EHM48_08705 [Planctomycetaceae bacterium]|nr:MAG: hypothetical protein EHM48_08705 [Planctomycetaceae bacterium]
MNIRSPFIMCAVATLIFGLAAQAGASQASAVSAPLAAASTSTPAPAPTVGKTLSETIADLEDAVAELTEEFTSVSVMNEGPAVSKDEKPAPMPLADVSDSSKPWSMQYRVIVTVVTFYNLNVSPDEGPELRYSEGSFIDPIDDKTHSFLLNDMGALSASHAVPMLCVVTYRPADRQLSESDIASIVPIDWINKETSAKQSK